MDTNAVQCIILWLIWLYILPLAFQFNEISLNFRLEETLEIQVYWNMIVILEQREKIESKDKKEPQKWNLIVFWFHYSLNATFCLSFYF